MECELKKNTKPCNLRYEAFLSIFSFIPGQRLHYRTLSHSFLYSTLAVLEPKVGSTMNRFCDYVRRKSTLAILSFVENKDLFVISTVCAGESGLLIILFQIGLKFSLLLSLAMCCILHDFLPTVAFLFLHKQYLVVCTACPKFLSCSSSL